MSKILTELFYGNIRPVESRPETEEYKELEKEFDKISNRFAECLKQQSKELNDEFTRIMDMRNLLLGFENEKAFQDGFCIGIQLIVSSYHEE